MSIQIIPSRRIVTCDACGESGDDLATNDKGVKEFRRLNGSLYIGQDKLDFNNKAVGDGGLRFEFCDNCHLKITDAINQAVKSIKEL